MSHICNVPNRNVSSWDPFHHPKTWNNNGEVKLQQDKQDDDDEVETQFNALDDDDDEENTRPTKEHVWWFFEHEQHEQHTRSSSLLLEQEENDDDEDDMNQERSSQDDSATTRRIGTTTSRRQDNGDEEEEEEQRHDEGEEDQDNDDDDDQTLGPGIQQRQQDYMQQHTANDNVDGNDDDDDNNNHYNTNNDMDPLLGGVSSSYIPLSSNVSILELGLAFLLVMIPLVIVILSDCWSIAVSLQWHIVHVVTWSSSLSLLSSSSPFWSLLSADPMFWYYHNQDDDDNDDNDDDNDENPQEYDLANEPVNLFGFGGVVRSPVPSSPPLHHPDLHVVITSWWSCFCIWVLWTFTLYHMQAFVGENVGTMGNGDDEDDVDEEEVSNHLLQNAALAVWMAPLRHLILHRHRRQEQQQRPRDEDVMAHRIQVVEGDGEPEKRIDLMQMVRKGDPHPCTFVAETDKPFSVEDVLTVYNNQDDVTQQWKDSFGRDLDEAGSWRNTDSSFVEARMVSFFIFVGERQTLCLGVFIEPCHLRSIQSQSICGSDCAKCCQLGSYG